MQPPTLGPPLGSDPESSRDTMPSGLRLLFYTRVVGGCAACAELGPQVPLLHVIHGSFQKSGALIQTPYNSSPFKGTQKKAPQLIETAR